MLNSHHWRILCASQSLLRSEELVAGALSSAEILPAALSLVAHHRSRTVENPAVKSWSMGQAVDGDRSGLGASAESPLPSGRARCPRVCAVPSISASLSRSPRTSPCLEMSLRAQKNHQNVQGPGANST